MGLSRLVVIACPFLSDGVDWSSAELLPLLLQSLQLLLHVFDGYDMNQDTADDLTKPHAIGQVVPSLHLLLTPTLNESYFDEVKRMVHQNIKQPKQAPQCLDEDHTNWIAGMLLEPVNDAQRIINFASKSHDFS